MTVRNSNAAAIITALPPITLRSLPQRSVRVIESPEADSSTAPRANVIAASTVSLTPNSSCSHGPNVTNSDSLAAIRPITPTIASHPAGGTLDHTDAALSVGASGGTARGSAGAVVQAGEHDDQDHARRQCRGGVRPPPRRRRRHQSHGADADQQSERPRHLVEPDDAAALGERHVVGDPRPGADDEDDVERADRHQSDGEPDDAVAHGDDEAAEGAPAQTEGDRATPRQVIDEPADRRRGKPADLGDGQGDAKLGHRDVQPVGDDGEERPDVAEQGVGAQPCRRDGGDVSPDRLGIGVVERPSEHPRRRYSGAPGRLTVTVLCCAPCDASRWPP